MRRQLCALSAAALFLAAPVPIIRREGVPPPSVHASVEDSLPREVEAQLRTVALLARARSPGSGPDPRLFGALTRLEEMLPRSASTRRAQEHGRRVFTDMVLGRSKRIGRNWETTRQSIERVIRRDSAYMSALNAVDRRLGRNGAHLSAASPPIKTILASYTVNARAIGKSSARSRSSLPLDQMRPGDIMIWDDRSGPPLVRFGIALYASKCTHTAIYLGETAARGGDVQRWTLEAQSPALGVRSAPMFPKWTRKGLHVALGHVNGIGAARGALIAAGAVKRYGTDGRTPYHLWPPWDKTYLREGVYCSQLVWSIYRQNGVDLDSNDWRYLAWFTIHNWFNPYAAPTAYFGVFPDEIKASKHISWYYDQVNQ